jgi:uncharacterized membrane protein
MNWLRIYLAICVPLLILDGIWLGLIAKDFYRRELGDLMASPIKIIPAAIFYLAYPIGLMMFAVMPALATASIQDAAIKGALFGLFCYGTYDLVNLATLKGWSTKLTLVDMAWGAVISSAVSALAVILLR